MSFSITDFDILCKLSSKKTICKKCQRVIHGKSKKNTISLSSAESFQSMVKVIHKDNNNNNTKYNNNNNNNNNNNEKKKKKKIQIQ